MTGFWFSLYECTSLYPSRQFIQYHTTWTCPHLTVSGDALITTAHARVAWARNDVFDHLISPLAEYYDPRCT